MKKTGILQSGRTEECPSFFDFTPATSMQAARQKLFCMNKN